MLAEKVATSNWGMGIMNRIAPITIGNAGYKHRGKLPNNLDEKVKLQHENPFIGIVLCKEKNNTVVEFAVKNIDKAMGVATYRTTKEAPEEMKGILPDAAQLARML